MYQAIEAISRGGSVEPLEPVQFEDNERLVILRISKRWEAANVIHKSENGPAILALLQTLRFANRPFADAQETARRIQELRDDWNDI